jgi:hypothetical protein
MKTMQQVVDETYAKYVTRRNEPGFKVSDDGGGQCQYLAPNGTRCAVGAQLPAEDARRLNKGNNSVATVFASSEYEDIVEKLAIGDLPGLISLSDFWGTLQKVHDDAAVLVGNYGNQTFKGKEFRERFKVNLRAFCKEFGLKYPGK